MPCRTATATATAMSTLQNNKQLLDEVEQNIVICQSRAVQITRSQRQIIDLRDTDKSRYLAKTKFNNCFIIQLVILQFSQSFSLIASVFKIVTKKRVREVHASF